MPDIRKLGARGAERATERGAERGWGEPQNEPQDDPQNELSRLSRMVIAIFNPLDVESDKLVTWTN
jgi:hypothetical protein